MVELWETAGGLAVVLPGSGKFTDGSSEVSESSLKDGSSPEKASVVYPLKHAELSLRNLYMSSFSLAVMIFQLYRILAYLAIIR